MGIASRIRPRSISAAYASPLHTVLRHASSTHPRRPEARPRARASAEVNGTLMTDVVTQPECVPDSAMDAGHVASVQSFRRVGAWGNAIVSCGQNDLRVHIRSLRSRDERIEDSTIG
eukprot:1656363-Amphidinium_carterae.1